jgi:hypothetical protein
MVCVNARGRMTVENPIRADPKSQSLADNGRVQEHVQGLRVAVHHLLLAPLVEVFQHLRHRHRRGHGIASTAALGSATARCQEEARASARRSQRRPRKKISFAQKFRRSTKLRNFAKFSQFQKLFRTNQRNFI